MQSLTNDVRFLTTFDFDAETIWMQASKSTPNGGFAYESQGAFGPKVGIWRILDLLDEFGVRATFFTPGWVVEHWTRAVEEVVRRGHELALHGYVHERTNGFTGRDEEEMVLDRALAAMEGSVGIRPSGYRPPGYHYSPDTLELLGARNFVYASGMQDDDAPYVHALPRPPIVEIPVFWHLADDLFGFGSDVRLPPSHVEEHWLSELMGLTKYSGRIFVPTMHPQLMGHPGRLAMLERLLKFAAELGVRFMRCQEVAAEVIAQHHSNEIGSG